MARAPELRSKRFLLRAIVPQDLPKIFEGLSHPDVIRYYGVNYQSLADTEKQMRWFAEPPQLWWAICSIDGKEFYGAAGFNDIKMDHRKAEIGIWLLPACWGKGIMTEVFEVICPYAQAELQLHRIEALVESENTACKKALEKLNFQWEGRMIDCEIKAGKFISLDIYALFPR